MINYIKKKKKKRNIAVPSILFDNLITITIREANLNPKDLFSWSKKVGG